MASINYAHKEIISKIVYYGPGLSGKTSNLQFVFRKVPAETRGELISLATDADRTLYFDFLPLNVGTIKGFATKFQLYTVPGQVYYNATRKLVLRGVDGIVFVADSQAEKVEENVESLQNLKDNLSEYGYDIEKIPMVIQYNKRDLPNAMEISELEKILNPKGLHYFEAVAPTGEGVFKTLKAISMMVLEEIRKNKMGAPNAVKPSQTKPEPKPEPVGVSKAPAAAGGPGKEGINSAAQPESGVSGQVAITAREMASPVQAPETSSGESEAEEKRKVPGIVEDSDVLANVVVSDSQKLPDEEERVADNGDLEETTERAILKDELAVAKDINKPEPESDREERVADESYEESKREREPIYDRSSENKRFDEEATQFSNLCLKNPLPLGRPQMAESRKVRNKHKKFNLFGLFKKTKK